MLYYYHQGKHLFAHFLVRITKEFERKLLSDRKAVIYVITPPSQYSLFDLNITISVIIIFLNRLYIICVYRLVRIKSSKVYYNYKYCIALNDY